MSNLVAFFYKKPVLLQADAHRDLCFSPTGTVEFAQGQIVVPLVLAEFGDACLEYPIVFAKSEDGQWMATALTGMRPGENVFVTPERKWDGRYVPAALRRYPFVLAKTGEDQYSVAADLDAPHFSEKVGDRIFNDDGTPAAFMQDMLALLQEFQNQADRTAKLLAQLEEHDLLEQTPVRLQTDSGQTVDLGSVWVVNEQKLLKAPESFLLATIQSGELGLLFAHLISLKKFADLLNKAETAAQSDPHSPQAAKATKATKATKAAKTKVAQSEKLPARVAKKSSPTSKPASKKPVIAKRAAAKKPSATKSRKGKS